MIKMILMPPVNASINFLMVSSCLTTFLFLALTLPPPDSCSMVTSGRPACSFWISQRYLPCNFLGDYASLQNDCAWAIVVEVVLHPQREMSSNHVDLKYLPHLSGVLLVQPGSKLFQ